MIIYLAGFFVLLLLVVLVYLLVWKYNKHKAKENAVKMSMVLTGIEDSEPLQPTNVKPNMGKLRTVKETEIRKGGILGSGAFGVVYKVRLLHLYSLANSLYRFGG